MRGGGQFFQTIRRDVAGQVRNRTVRIHAVAVGHKFIFRVQFVEIFFQFAQMRRQCGQLSRNLRQTVSNGRQFLAEFRQRCRRQRYCRILCSIRFLLRNQQKIPFIANGIHQNFRHVFRNFQLVVFILVRHAEQNRHAVFRQQGDQSRLEIAPRKQNIYFPFQVFAFLFQ